MEPWFRRYPDHYEREQKAFEELGIAVIEDQKMKGDGILRLTITIDGNNPNFSLDKEGTYKFVVAYPDNYPWFRPQVYAYELNLPRHQHPSEKNLCLLPRSTRFWYTEQTVAHLLKSQLSEVLAKGKVEDLEIVKNDPQEQAEPVSDFYQYHSSVLFNPEEIPTVEIKESCKVIGKMIVGFPENAPLFSRMAVKEISVAANKKVFSLNSEVQQMFPRSLEGIVIRVEKAPPVVQGPQLLEWLKKCIGKDASSLNSNRRLSFRDVTYTNVIAINFPEEVVQGELGSGWIFMVLGNAMPQDKNNKPIAGKSQKPIAYLSKAAYFSMDSQKDRVPKLIPLGTKKIALIGLGALGGYVAIELARSGIKELRVLDFDTVDPPTTVRWPLGLTAAGLQKTDVIKNFIKVNYPYTEVKTEHWRIGDLRCDGQIKEILQTRSESDLIESLTAEVDLIIDATAEEGINNYLSRFAYQKDLPYISMYATPGAWGGVVMRYLPGVTGCWSCMKQWQTENDKLVPPSDENGEIQPPGCGDLTFTGAGFDLQNISLAAVRLAVSTLCNGIEVGYSKVDWDWAVLKLVNQHGHPIPPEWIAQRLNIHPNCPYNGYH